MAYRRVFLSSCSIFAANLPDVIPENDRSIGENKLQNARHKCLQLIKRYKEEYAVPGICVGVSIGGRPVFMQGVGYSNVESLTPCSPETSMRIASISKAISMALFAKLIQEGKLDLDLPVQNYVPEFPRKEFEGEAVEITGRHLVTHTSGIRHYSKVMKDKENNKPGEKKENKIEIPEFNLPEYYSMKHYICVVKALDMFKDDELHNKPGADYLYTSHGWTLASAVAERAGGQPFLKQMNELLRALNMTHTFPEYNSQILPNRSAGYVRDLRRKLRHKLTNVHPVDNSYKWAAGGYVSTIGDLLLFANHMLYCYQNDDGFLSKETMSKLWSPAVKISNNNGTTLNPSHYGNGWMVEPSVESATPMSTWTESNYVCHSGGAIGASSLLLIIPSNYNSPGRVSGICVAILVNLQEAGDIHKLGRQIAQLFREALQIYE